MLTIQEPEHIITAPTGAGSIMQIVKPAGRNQYITFARAYAIISIIIYHFLLQIPLPATWSHVAGLGGGGVHLFIFASGFGLYLSKYTNFGAFLKKRFTKVLIPYFLAITLIFTLNLALHLFPDGLPAFLSHIFLYKMFIEEYEGSFGGQFWFVSTIIQLYLVFPLLLWAVKRLPPVICWCCFLGISIAYSAVYLALGWGQLRVVNGFFLQYVWEFVLGMLIAKHGLMDRLTSMKWYWTFLLALTAYIIMAAMVLKLGNAGQNLNDLFSFAGYLLFSVFVFNLAKKSSRLLTVITKVESFSYALFLTHTFVYTFFAQHLLYPVAIWQIGPVVAIALLFAWVFQLLLNKLPALLSPAPKSGIDSTQAPNRPNFLSHT